MLFRRSSYLLYEYTLIVLIIVARRRNVCCLWLVICHLLLALVTRLEILCLLLHSLSKACNLCGVVIHCMLEIEEVRTESQILVARKLFREYASSLGISLDFQNFDQELAELPGQYALPDGCILLARWQNQVAGCVGLRRFRNGICEMKRLYTLPGFRGLGIGRTLCEAVIHRARRVGYERMRLDTLPWMNTARSLYVSLGFREIDPYRLNPVEGAVFMELIL